MRKGIEDGVRFARRGVGFAASGPGFYVWDLEPRAVIDSANALRRAALAPRPARPGPMAPPRRGRGPVV